jgi:purine-nucleoside phosphorylase
MSPIDVPSSTLIPEDAFNRLQNERYAEWLKVTRDWVFGGPDIAQKVGPYLIFVHSSEGNPEKHLLSRMEDVRMYGGFPVQGGGSAVGTYRGIEIWILHQYMGCTATQMWMECLAGTRVRYLIGLADMTAYPDHVAVGDIVLPSSAIRGDLVTDFHVPGDLPANADRRLLERLEEKLRDVDWDVHVGQVYSGMPGGVGVHNPILRERIWQQIKEGVIGNAIETSVTYVESSWLGIRAAEAWVVSDDLNYGTVENVPGGAARWEGAWSLMAQAALDVLCDIADEERNR